MPMVLKAILERLDAAASRSSHAVQRCDGSSFSRHFDGLRAFRDLPRIGRAAAASIAPTQSTS